MKKWVVKFDDLETVDTLESLGILSYKPLFYEELKLVFIQTDMEKDKILKLQGVKSCREDSIGTVWV